jgi:hypothetical protein
MPKRSSKKPSSDISLIAHRIIEEATGEPLTPEAKSKEPTKEPAKEKNPAAVALGRLGGLKGGKARAKALTKKERSEIARKAAKTRWKKKNKE